MLLLVLLPCITARGPPGMRPPSSFVAESWYPSNLPTVRPPWKEPGVDINLFRTQEFSDNSVTSPLDEETTALPAKTTKMAVEFQEDNITEILINATDSSREIIKAEEAEGSGDVEQSDGLANSTQVSPAMQVESSPMTAATTISSSRGTATSSTGNSTVAEEVEETTSRPFTSRENLFDLEDKAKEVKQKSRGEGETEKKKNERKACSDLIFVVDSSGNVVAQYEKQKELVRFILLSLGRQSRRLGLITYAGRRKQRWNISPRHNVTREQYLKKLKKARFLGGVTATGSVLSFVAKETVATRSTVVLLTDGFSFDEVEEAAEELRESPSSPEIFVTGDYFPLVRNVLTSITGDPAHVFFAPKEVRGLIELLKC